MQMQRFNDVTSFLHTVILMIFYSKFLQTSLSNREGQTFRSIDCRYVDQKGLVAMLTSIQSAGVTPDMNLRNSVQTRKHRSEESALALQLRADITRNPKQRYQWPYEKDLCPPKILKKKNLKKSKNKWQTSKKSFAFLCVFELKSLSFVIGVTAKSLYLRGNSYLAFKLQSDWCLSTGSTLLQTSVSN